MRYGKCYSSFLLLLVAGLVASSCTKSDGIDNNKVIRTPYTVFYGEKVGTITKTNDGISYEDIFTPDGVPARAIAVSGENIVFIKSFLRYSTNNGLNFNQPVPGQAIPSVNPNAHWASMILDVPGDRLYVASATSSSGIEVSSDNGKSWEPDPGSVGITAPVSSFVRTNDGKVYALDPTGSGLYLRPSSTSAWTPISATTGLPAGTSWYLSYSNNTLLAADYSGAQGVYYSDDGGLNWKNFQGLPSSQEVLSCASPLDQVVLAGTDSMGVYMLDPTTGTFSPSNNGLLPQTSVYGIVGKQDIYKNGIIKRYVYITTNNGLYRSEDFGHNWVLMKTGNTRAIW